MIKEAHQIILDYEPHKFQRAFHKSTAKFRAAKAGRRSGKTYMAAYEGHRMTEAVQKDPQRYGHGMILAPTYKMTRQDYDYFVAICEEKKQKARAIGKNFFYKASAANYQPKVVLQDGFVVECRSGDDPEKLKSEGLDWIIFDECALISERCWTESIRPAMIGKKGRIVPTRAVFISTPKGHNWFDRIVQKGQNRDRNPSFESWQFSSKDNPHVSKQDIDDLISEGEMTEEQIRQEIYAESLDSSFNAFTSYDKCAIGMPLDRPIPGNEYVMSVDLGRKEDYTTIGIMDRRTRALVQAYRLDLFMEWEDIELRILQEWNWWGRPVGYIDATGLGDVVYGDLRKRGLTLEPFIFTSSSKEPLINHLRYGFEHRNLTIIDPKCCSSAAILYSELGYYEKTQTESGHIKFFAPDGCHDDMVIMLALGYWGCANAFNVNSYPFAKIDEYDEALIRSGEVA